MPHRIGFLKDKICTPANVRRAWETYNRNRPPKLRRKFDAKIADEILAAMRAGRFDLGPLRRKVIHEGQKPRRLRIPSFYSTIAQTALFNVVGPILDKRIHSQSFSSRKGYGMHRCAMKQNRFIQTHHRESRYCLYFDIRKCYDHIRHEDVLETVDRVIKDPFVLRAIENILNYGGAGLPIGFPASHTFANLLLTPLYHLLIAMRGITKVFVYMDNFIVYAAAKAPLRRAFKAARRWLAVRGMAIKDDWQIFPVDARPIHTCGFLLQRGRRPKIYRHIFTRICRNIRDFTRFPTVALARSLASRLGWLSAIGKTHIVYSRITHRELRSYL